MKKIFLGLLLVSGVMCFGQRTPRVYDMGTYKKDGEYRYNSDTGNVDYYRYEEYDPFKDIRETAIQSQITMYARTAKDYFYEGEKYWKNKQYALAKSSYLNSYQLYNNLYSFTGKTNFRISKANVYLMYLYSLILNGEDNTFRRMYSYEVIKYSGFPRENVNYLVNYYNDLK